MEENEAVKSVATELGNSNALLGFKPVEVKEKFFIGQAILIAAAGIFVSSFLKGVNSALEEEGKKLGESVTKWLIGKLEGLFRKPQVSKADEAEIKKNINDWSQSAAKIDKTTLNKRLNAVENLVTATLKKRGVMPNDATKIAKKTREAVETYISKDDAHGSK